MIGQLMRCHFHRCYFLNDIFIVLDSGDTRDFVFIICIERRRKFERFFTRAKFKVLSKNEPFFQFG